MSVTPLFDETWCWETMTTRMQFECASVGGSPRWVAIDGVLHAWGGCYPCAAPPPTDICEETP